MAGTRKRKSCHREETRGAHKPITMEHRRSEEEEEAILREEVKKKITEEKREMEEGCSMCKQRAAIVCDSDQAKLCWDCDEKVHSANFLVAKHWRVGLCVSCRSRTPWKASGEKLTPTVAFCQSCVAHADSMWHWLLNNIHQYRPCANPRNNNGAERENESASASWPSNSFCIDSHDETACSSSSAMVIEDATLPNNDSSSVTLLKMQGHDKRK
ncbi:unnamed protein product [Sphenostylis stenocarpa]|uniref:B box-type domain-containing protein n=1 Tax=Sphenostylis stenocarpa TaxID=92480 RepID=A0AA86V5T5_9FABA|nr:unnamed protein product [Sphenostylis stenocarpa]